MLFVMHFARKAHKLHFAKLLKSVADPPTALEERRSHGNTRGQITYVSISFIRVFNRQFASILAN
jgi:hypothetical protein